MKKHDKPTAGCQLFYEIKTVEELAAEKRKKIMEEASFAKDAVEDSIALGESFDAWFRE